MHFARLVEQASATRFYDLFVYGAYISELSLTSSHSYQITISIEVPLRGKGFILEGSPSKKIYSTVDKKVNNMPL